MPRYILIDNHSGYIFGDTADLNGPARDETPADAAYRLDASIGEHGRSYEHVGRYELASNETGYHVYRSDSATMETITDGQDPAAIAAVQRDCQWVSTIRCSRPD